jgi:hypothetical protein
MRMVDDADSVVGRNPTIAIQRRNRRSLKSVGYDLTLGLFVHFQTLGPPLVCKEVRFYQNCLTMDFFGSRVGNPMVASNTIPFTHVSGPLVSALVSCRTH